VLAAIRASDRRKVYSFHSKKIDGPWECPDPQCGEKLLLRVCSDKIDHFAHYPGSTCGHSSGETELHWRAKKDIFERLLRDPRVTGLELERVLKGCRPDVSFYYDGRPIAIEVQLSSIPLYEISRRTKRYFQLGIAVLWVNLTPREEGDVFLPKDWERWLSSLGFGSYFQWRPGLCENTDSSINDVFILEGITWEKVLRRKRVKYCDTYQLEEMVPVYRTAWRGAWEVPECYVVIENSQLNPKKPAFLRRLGSTKGLDPLAFGDPTLTWSKEEFKLIKRDVLNPDKDSEFVEVNSSEVLGVVEPVQEFQFPDDLLDDSGPPQKVERPVDFDSLLEGI
jgi:hypothetical protein